MLEPLFGGVLWIIFNPLFMFKVYNHSLQKEEYVEKIDLNKHWKAYLVPFDTLPETPKVEEEVTEEEEIAPKKKGRPKAN